LKELTESDDANGLSNTLAGKIVEKLKEFKKDHNRKKVEEFEWVKTV